MGKGKYIGNPSFRVHTQTGAMLGATSGKLVSSNPATYRVKIDTGVAPHAIHVIQGTKVMLGRDVMWSTATAKGTQKELMKTAVALLGKGLRAQASVRFDPDPEASVRMTILAINNASLNMHAVGVVATGVMGGNLLGLIKQNISLKDHTPAGLAKMGHPYADRHGTIRIHS